MARLKYHEDDNGKVDIRVDDTRLRGVRHICIENSVHGIAETEIEISPKELDIDIMTNLCLVPEIKDEYDAVMCLKLYMKMDEEFRKAVVASAKSVLDEVRRKNRTDVINDYELAEAIVERIFFGERI